MSSTTSCGTLLRVNTRKTSTMTCARDGNVDDLLHCALQTLSWEKTTTGTRTGNRKITVREKNLEIHHVSVCEELECQRSAPQHAVWSSAREKNLEDPHEHHEKNLGDLQKNCQRAARRQTLLEPVLGENREGLHRWDCQQSAQHRTLLNPI